MQALANLPPLSVEEIKRLIAELIQRMGDLSAYIIGVDRDDPPRLQLVGFGGRPACSTVPPPTTLDTQVEADRMQKAADAARQLNDAFALLLLIECKVINQSCLDQATLAPDVPNEEPQLGGRARLPRLGPEQIKVQIAVLRSDLSDLNEYAFVAKGEIVYKAADEKGGGVPGPKTALDKAVAAERLEGALDVLKIANTLLNPPQE